MLIFEAVMMRVNTSCGDKGGVDGIEYGNVGCDGAGEVGDGRVDGGGIVDLIGAVRLIMMLTVTVAALMAVMALMAIELVKIVV